MQKAVVSLLVLLASGAAFGGAGMGWVPVEMSAVPVPTWSEGSLYIVGALISLAAYRLLRKRR